MKYRKNYLIRSLVCKRGSRICTGAMLLVAIGVMASERPVFAGEAEKAFEQLAKRYHSQRKEYINAYFSAETDEDRARVDRELDPAKLLLDRFFEMEKAHRKSIVGLSALYHILVDTAGRHDPETPKMQAKQRALKILKGHYSTHPDLDYVVRILSPASKLPEQQALFKAAEEHPARRVRAMALLQRAERKRNDAIYPVEIDSKIELLSTDREKHGEEIDRWKTVRGDRLDVDPEASRQEALRLAKRIVDEYADVLQPPRVGRSPVLLPAERKRIDPLTKKPRRSFGEVAESIRFQLTRLAIGSEAPNISGPDALGTKRSLHDQRGKVIVLMFSFTGCGPCERMYPDNRKLLKKYADRPFAFLGVMGDEKIDTVKKCIDNGKITWPVWWDGGVDGPISSRWNVEGWPDIYAIDHKGVIRYRELRGDALAIAVEKLIAEAEQGK